jgi:hypothetical protein
MAMVKVIPFDDVQCIDKARSDVDVDGDEGKVIDDAVVIIPMLLLDSIESIIVDAGYILFHLLLFSGFKYRSHGSRDRKPPQESGKGDGMVGVYPAG